MTIPLYRARDLAAMDMVSLWSLPDGPIDVAFDALPSGEPQVLRTDSRLTSFSAMCWRLYVEFPLTPAKISHHIGDRRLNATTHMTLMNRVTWDCYDAYHGEVDLEELCFIAYKAGTNRYYNETSIMLEADVSTISIEDMVDVVDHPEIAEAIEAIDGSTVTIGHAHEVALKVLKDPEALPGNPISAAMRSGLVKSDQVLQTLIARGKVSDIDSRYFNEAIPSSFLSGMNSIYESMTESRSSTKAAAYKEKPIEDSEYFNRRLQLMAATVDKLEQVGNVLNEEAKGLQVLPGDCGTTRTMRWPVKERDLPALEGKYYKDADSASGWTVIREGARHLVGQVLELRSVMLCQHHHPQSICMVCYGELALSLPRGTNMGHVASVDYGERVTQNMLSIKHSDFAGKEKPLTLTSYEREFLEVIPGTRTIRFKPILIGRKLMLSVDGKDVEQLAELQYIKEDVTELPVSRISEIGMFYLTADNGKGERETVPLNVETDGKSAHFTHPFLEHIRQHGYILSDTGRYLIDVTGFDMTQPVFEVPNRDVNILDYLKSIIQFITSTEDKKRVGPGETAKRMLKGSRTPEEALMALQDLTSVRMTVNLVHQEVLIYSTMVRSPTKLDYRLPYQGNALIFEQLSRVIQNRSLSAAMAFEGHTRVLRDPATYINDKRPDHILDDLLLPRNAQR